MKLRNSFRNFVCILFFFLNAQAAEKRITYLHLLPLDLLAPLAKYFAEPSSQNDDCPDFFIQTGKAMRIFDTYLANHITLSDARTNEMISNFIKNQLYYAHLLSPFTNSSFQANPISAACAINTQSAVRWLSNIAKKTYKDILLAMKQEEKDTVFHLIINLFPSPSLVDTFIKYGVNIESKNSSSFTPLRAAVNNNAQELVQLLLLKGARVDTTDFYRITPLMQTVLNNNYTICHALLKAQAPVNQIDAFGNTALSLAAKRNNHALVDLLLEHKAIVTISDDRCHNTLSQAVASKDPALIAKLLQPKVFNQDSPLLKKCILNDALKAAATHGLKDIVFVLINYAQDTHTEIEIPIDYAIRNLQYDLALALLAYKTASPRLGAVNEKVSADTYYYTGGLAEAIRQKRFTTSETGLTKLNAIIDSLVSLNQSNTLYSLATSICAYEAAVLQDYELLMQIIKSVKNVNAIDELLHYAIFRGSKRAVKTILQCPTLDTSYKSLRSLNALTAAVQLGHVSIVRKLIRAGFDTLQQDSKHNNLLHIILKKHSGALALKLAKSCLINTAIVNQADENRVVPLMLAAIGSESAMVRLLLKAEARVDVANWLGASVMHYCVKNPDPKEKIAIADLLLSKGASLNQLDLRGNSAFFSIFTNNLDQHFVVHLLLNHANKIEINQTNQKKETVLMRACKYCSEQVIELLLQQGANPNAKNKSECGALTKAAGRGSLTTIQLLGSHGAQLASFKDGMLRNAARQGHTELVKFLLANGASINSISSSYGNTPLLKAVFNKHTSIVTLLLKEGCDIKIRNAQGKNALDIALETRQDSMVKLLMGMS